MKTRIEEAFFPWFQEQDPERFYSKELAARDGFIAGAEFMQKEVDILEADNKFQASVMVDMGGIILENEKLKAQNEIMREALDTIRYKPTPYHVLYTYQEKDYYHTIAGEALKKMVEV